MFLSINIRQWRRKWEFNSLLEPQLESGSKQFWKLYLNLYSRKWLNPWRGRVIRIIISLFKVDFTITFYNYKKPINVNQDN